MNRIIGSRRAQTVGQGGMTLIEILIGIVIAGIIMTPLSAWALGTLRTQNISKDELGRANSTGLLNSYFLRDAASARNVALEADGARDCTSPPGPASPSAGGRVVLRLFQAGTGTRSVVYSEAGGSGSTPAVLWRRVCGSTGELVEATKVFSRVVFGSVGAGCPEPSSTAANACVSASKVSLTLTPWVASGGPKPPIVISATRRTGAASTGLASSSPPDPRFTVTPNRGYRGTQFTATSTSTDPDGGPLTLKWTLPTGSSIISGSVTATDVTFTIAQTGTLVLVVSDGSSSNAAESRIEIVNLNPTVSATDCTLTVDRTFQLTVTASDNDGDPLSFAWSGPDGVAVSTAQNPEWTAPASLAGPQYLALVVSDGSGGQSSAFAKCILPEPVVPGGVVFDPVLINGQFINAIPQAGSRDVTFRAADPIPAGATTSFELFRKGGTTAVNSKQNATVWTLSFASGEEGEYEIVRVTDVGGQVTRGARVPFRVNAAPRATLAISGQAGKVPDCRVTFSSTVSDADGSVVSQVWNFGDGSPAETNPALPATHVYTTPGDYTATLTVTDNDAATTVVTVSVSPTP